MAMFHRYVSLPEGKDLCQLELIYKGNMQIRWDKAAYTDAFQTFWKKSMNDVLLSRERICNGDQTGVN